jgi:hypothetical protein
LGVAQQGSFEFYALLRCAPEVRARLVERLPSRAELVPQPLILFYPLSIS